VTTQTIDEDAIRRLLEVIGGDREDLQELTDEFEEETPKLVAKMRAAVAEGDHDALRIHAHSLKSNGRDFGAVRLAGLSERLEQQCRAGEVADPAAQVEDIGQELDRARAALRELTFPDG
jgi:HPt (histidine-containing phosphotransfer) domain-containing protein